MFTPPGFGDKPLPEEYRKHSDRWAEKTKMLIDSINNFKYQIPVPTSTEEEDNSNLTTEELIQKRQQAFEHGIATAWMPFNRGRSARDFKASTDGLLPEGVLENATLYPHQEEAIKGLIELEDEMGGALLCDEMGLGKTLEAIGLMAFAPVDQTLVVVPASMATTWHNALVRHLPTMPVVTHLENRKTNEWNGQWRIVLTTYDIAKAEVKDQGARYEALRKLYSTEQEGQQSEFKPSRKPYLPIPSHKWDRIVFDEAHRLRNDTLNKKMAVFLKARSKILLTGTPFQNQHKDFQSYFEILDVQPWANNEWFKRAFIDKGLKDEWHPSEPNLDRAAILSMTLRGIMIRRTREDLFDGGAIVQTPGSSDETLLNRNTTQAEKRAQMPTKNYWDRVQCDSSMAKNTQSDISQADVLRMLTNARLAAVHEACPGAYLSLPMDEVDVVASEEDQDEEMPVEEMLNEGEAKASQLSREEFKARRQHDWRSSSKLQQAVELAKDALISGSKILFFSEFLSAVDALAAALTDSSIAYAEFNGTMNRDERKAVVDDFENNDQSVKVLLLTAAGGEGITLVKASVVVILTPSWNPFIDLQMKYRADRIGQTQFVRTYRLINDESFEQYVEKTQRMKMHNSRWMIQSSCVDLSLRRVREWTEEDFLRKFKELSS